MRRLQTVIHRVKLTDPVSPSEPARTYSVVQYQTPNGFPVGYALSINAHVCTDNKCKTLAATLYWDALGYYQRFEWPLDKPFTKKEHVPFAEEDYAKLDGILQDRSSVLGRQSLGFLAQPVENDQQVDAWSGATPLTVQASVVKDAAFTTWVLWQWANGETVPKLQRLTERSCTPEYLEYLLASDDRRHVDFALQYVLEHHPSDERFLDGVFRVLETGGRDQVGLSLRFVTRAMPDKERLHARLIDACCRMKSTYSPLVLAYFQAEPDLPPTTLERFTGQLDRLPYFPVHLILKTLEERKFFSEKTEADVCRLLDSEDFFIARRACEFLLRQELSPETQGKVSAFRDRNRNRM